VKKTNNTGQWEKTAPPAIVGERTGSVDEWREGSLGTFFHLKVMAQLKPPRTSGAAAYCGHHLEPGPSSPPISTCPYLKSRVVDKVNDRGDDVRRVFPDALQQRLDPIDVDLAVRVQVRKHLFFFMPVSGRYA
jgi:hypothetical protein